jgi:hypothetical protein
MRKISLHIEIYALHVVLKKGEVRIIYRSEGSTVKWACQLYIFTSVRLSVKIEKRETKNDYELEAYTQVV